MLKGKNWTLKLVLNYLVGKPWKHLAKKNNNNNTFWWFWIRGGFCKKKNVDSKVLSSGEWSEQRELLHLWRSNWQTVEIRDIIIRKPLWVADLRIPLLTLSFAGMKFTGLPDAKTSWNQLLVYQVEHLSMTQKAHHKVSSLFSSSLSLP